MTNRTALIAAGAILIIGGGAVSAAGGAVLAAVGTDSRISSGSHAVSTPTSAFVTEKGDISHHGTGVFGRPSIRISVTGADKPVFVGVGPADAVDRYLAGAAVETVTDFGIRPFTLTTTRHEGTGRLSSPQDQTFWVEQAHGTTSATASWNLHGGSYRVVVMNADGSPGVNVDGQLSARVPNLSTIGASVLGGGLLVFFTGIALLVIGLRTKHESYVAATVTSHPATSSHPVGV
jgi:hypothetical protein